MATVITDDKHYKGIAEKIREMAENDTAYQPSDMAAGVETVYGKGYENGVTSEYDRFWNEFQDYSNRTDYTFAFRHWSADYIRPKYKVQNITLQAQQMFQFAKIKKLEAEHFDFTGADKLNGTVYGMFNACRQLEEIEDVNIPATNYSATWYNCVLLRKIAIVRCAADKAFDRAFYNCEALEEVTFTGTMSTNGLDLHFSKKLNRASIESVIDVLSASTSGRTVTLSVDAVNRAFETSEGANDGSTSSEWAEKILEKSKWTISVI